MAVKIKNFYIKTNDGKEYRVKAFSVKDPERPDDPPVVWRDSWVVNLELGNCVTKIRYSIDNENWTETTSNVNLEVDWDNTLYVQAVEYENDTNNYVYTNHNFNATLTNANDGQTITVYRDKQTRYYTTTVNAGTFITTLKAGIDNTYSSGTGSSVTVTHTYNQTIYWQLVDYAQTDAEYTYSGDVSGSFNGGSGTTQTINRTRTKNQYTITWSYESTYGNLTTTTATYYYGDIPGTATPISGSVPSPVDVTSGNNKHVYLGWDSLSTVIADRTINATYQQHYYATISGTRCSADLTTGWYNSGTIITWTADTNCAFNSTGSQTTDTATINSGTTYSKSANYVNVTSYSGSNCSTTTTTGWKSYGADITWTASSNYAFDSNGTTATTTDAIPGVNSCSATHGKYTVTTGSYATANVSTGWYPITNSKTTTFTADSNHSFNGSNVSDTTTRSAAVPGSVDCGNPQYSQIKVQSNYCSSISLDGTVISSGWSGLAKVGKTITWTASNNYSFEEGTSAVTTKTETVKVDKYGNVNTYWQSADCILCNISSTKSTCDKETGWYRKIGTIITWTASGAPANTKYSFKNTSTTEPTEVFTDTVSMGKTSYTANAQYTYYNVTINIGANTASCDYSSGYILANTYVTFTAVASTTNKRYSYNSIQSYRNTTSVKVNSAGQVINSPTVYIYMNCTCSGTHCSATDGWRRVSTHIVWTADSDSNTGVYYSFVNTSFIDTTSTAVLEDITSYSATASYIYYQITVSAQPNSSCTAGGSGKYLSSGSGGGAITSTFVVSDSNTYTFNADHTGKSTKTVTWAVDSSKTITGPAVYSRTYAVSITRSTGVSSVYLSTNSTATSGDGSGTRYAYNSTVYAFAVLAEGYNALGSWTLVNGTANTTGAKYRVDSTTTTQDRDFGNISANVKTFTITVNSHSFGTVYLNNVAQSGNFTASYWDTIKVNLPGISYINTTYESLTDPTISRAYNATYGYRISIKNNFPRDMSVTQGSSTYTVSSGNTQYFNHLSSNITYNFVASVSRNQTDNYTKYGYSKGSSYTYNTSSSSQPYSWTVKGACTISWDSTAHSIAGTDSYTVNLSMITGKQVSVSASRSYPSEQQCKVTITNTSGTRANGEAVPVYVSDARGHSATISTKGGVLYWYYDRPSYVGGSSYTVYIYCSPSDGGDSSGTTRSIIVETGRWS